MRVLALVWICLGSLFSQVGFCADLLLPSLFSDHMVLQQKQPLPVWGKGTPGSQVVVYFRQHQAQTIISEDGSWCVDLPAQLPGAPASLTVESGDQRLEFSDVLVGEVWLASGQSNMEWPVARSLNPDAEIAAADHPAIRLFHVPRRASQSPETMPQGSWKICSPESVSGFSAVAYYFGRKIHQETGLPVGLIAASWGGTPAEAWTPLSTLSAKPEYAEVLKSRESKLAVARSQPEGLRPEEIAKRLEAFMKKAREAALDRTAPPSEVFLPGYRSRSSLPLVVPGTFLEQTDGVARLRTEFVLSASQATSSAVLELGPIDDFDATWINNESVGYTGPDTPRAYARSRSYPLPAGVLREGVNVLVIHVIDWLWSGAIGSPSEMPHVRFEDGTRVALDGEWTLQSLADWGPRPDSPAKKLHNIGATLYDGMIHPLIPYALRGVIWYQGESNVGRAQQYRTLFPDLIQSWRAAWDIGDFPFLFVQLANYKARNAEPVNDPWANLREAQRLTLALPRTGMAVAIDIGDPDDIHPKNKQEVGRRLALWALADTYHVTQPVGALGSWPWLGRFFQEPLTPSGPLFQKAVPDGSAVMIHFAYDSGLATSDGKDVRGFALAGADGIFQWSHAEIKGDVLRVSHPQILEPRAVRYGWSINPDVNLINAAGLPAAPFEAAW